MNDSLKKSIARRAPGLAARLGRVKRRIDQARAKALPAWDVDGIQLPKDENIVNEIELSYKLFGTFIPNLRLLIARSDDGGATFGAFEDKTESTSQVPNPDPTRIRGKTQFSVIKVSCAELDCTNPIFEVDDDDDGFQLCRDGEVEDCNDDNDEIFPGAMEICDNRRDDDCNGFTDELDEENCGPMLVQLGEFGAEIRGRGPVGRRAAYPGGHRVQ